MLPYLIAGAIGFGIGKLFEEGGETFGRGGITTNEGIIKSFLNSNKELRVGNLEAVDIDDIMYLRNYRTFIAKRMGDKVKISSQKYSQTTSTITNRLKALAQEMGYSVEYVSEKEIYDFDKFAGGGEVQDELYDLVSDFDSNEYEAFCYEFDIDIDDANQMTDFISQLSDEDAKNIINQIENGYFSDSEDEYDIGGEIIGERKSDMTPIYKFFREESEYETLNYKGKEYDFDLIFGFHNGGIDSESGNELPSGYYARIDPLGIADGSTKHILKKNDFEYSFVGELWNLTMLILKAEEDTKENKNQAIKIFEEKRTDLINEFKEYINDYVLGTYSEYAGGGEAKKRRRRANAQTGRTDRSVDKTRVGKPVGYRFSNSLASKLRKDKYAVPTEKQITKYLGKGIYKENRRNRSDRDKMVKL